MKFIPIYYISTLVIIARDNCVEGAEELSENDLKFIADRLYPAECYQLLNYLPGNRVSQHRGYRDQRIDENSSVQCLESLYECNRSGKTVRCTKNLLLAALHKLGRADLASRLKKRSKKKKKKNKMKNTTRRSKKPRAERREEPEKNHKHYSRKKAVTSHARGVATKAAHKSNIAENLFGRRFMIFLVSASVLVLVFLGCIVIVSYKRAYRCYKNYLRCENDLVRDDKRCSLDKSFVGQSGTLEESNKTREINERKPEYTKIVLESDRGKTDDLSSEELDGSPNVRRSKNVSFDNSAEATDEKGCNCGRVQSKRTMSPCARIKRFFDARRRNLHGEEDHFIVEKRGKRISERKKRRKSSRDRSLVKKSIDGGDCDARKSKNNQRKSKKYAGSRGKRANRERRTKAFRSNHRDAEASKPIGCTCEMCKLFNITGDGGCNDRVSNNRSLDSPNERTVERQRMTKRRKG